MSNIREVQPFPKNDPFLVVEPFSHELTSGEIVEVNSMVSDTILNLDSNVRLETLSNFLEIVETAFPGLSLPSAVDQTLNTERIFPGVQRQLITVENQQDNKLAALGLFDQSYFAVPGKNLSYISICYRAISPSFQGKGLGTMISSTILEQLNPDILITQCAQTASLKSWLKAVHGDTLSSKYNVFPDSIPTPQGDSLQLLSEEEKELIVDLYRYHSIRTQKAPDFADATISVLDSSMIARGYYGTSLFPDKVSWNENDPLTQKLSLTEKDAVFVVCMRQ